MKTLDELKLEMEQVKEKIMCQEIGNSSCYLSPIYHELLIKLEGLEREIEFLSGKSAFADVNFEDYPPIKRDILKKISEEYGVAFVSNYKDLSADDLRFLYGLMKEN